MRTQDQPMRIKDQPMRLEDQPIEEQHTAPILRPGLNSSA